MPAAEHEAYHIGWVPFLGVRVDLSARPLIPRPETEFWTEKALDLAAARGLFAQPGARVLDLFCGSGCIGLAVLKRAPQARADFADIEPRYFPGIRKSMRMNRIAPRRARFVRSDVFAALGAGRYDLILANPPYIAARGRYVQSSVLRQEPHAALFGGPDGLRFIRALLRSARRRLTPGGMLAFEFDTPQKAAIAALARRHGWAIVFHKDQYGRWRWAVAEPARGQTKKPS